MQPNDLAKIETLLSYFSIPPSQISVAEEVGVITITVQMEEAEAGRLIGRFAQTLDSLQLIISLMLNQGDTHRHVLLDVAGYRARRLETLTAMMENAKEQALSSGLPCALPPLSSTERRQIHVMLQDDAELTSYSEGYGQERRLYIAPKTV